MDCTGVVVRLLCGSRQGQLDAPAWSLPLTEHRLTRHTVAALGPAFVAEMRRHIRTKTYAQSKPQALTNEAWVDSINSTLLRVAGVDDRLGGGGKDEGLASWSGVRE